MPADVTAQQGLQLTPVPARATLGGWLRLAAFDYEPPRRSDDEAVLRLIGEVQNELGVPGEATLTVRHGRLVTGYGAALGCEDALWQASFTLPLDVVEHPGALFLLRSPGRLAIALPRPHLRLVSAGPPALELAERPHGALAGARRQVAALGAGVVVALASGGISAGALAGTTADPSAADPGAATPTTTTDTTLTDTSPAGTTTTPPTTTGDGSAPAATVTTTTTTPTATTTTPATTTTTTPAPTATVPVPTVVSTTPQAPGGAAKPGARGNSKKRAHAGKPNRRKRFEHGHNTGHAKHAAGAMRKKIGPDIAEDRTEAAPNPGSTAALDLTFGASPFSDQQLSRLAKMFAAADQPPAFLIPIYKQAGRRYRVPWKVLAAINAVETNYGRDLAISPAGAMGWMQFMPGTWLEWGVSASRRATPNPYDPRDAIFSAARYLEAAGARTNLRKAIFAYNHAIWYVDEVLWRAKLITGKHRRHKLRAGYALPLDARYMRHLGRTDDGVDIEDAPDGALVYSITSGVVTAVASDPSGFGPNYPVILATRGPLAGQYIYYGHVAASVVKVGQHVAAGQPIAIMGHTGDAVSLGHGHIEIGFSDGSGDPLNHHGALAFTASGAAMRQVIVDISTAFKVRNR